MALDFSMLERLFTDSRASGMYVVRASPHLLDEIGHFVATIRCRLFSLDNREVNSFGEMEHIISVSLGYTEVYYHDDVGDGFSEYMDENFDQFYKEKGFESNGTIIVFRGIQPLFIKIKEHIPMILDVFREAASARIGSHIPMYLIFIVEEDELITPELQAQFDKFGVKSIG